MNQDELKALGKQYSVYVIDSSYADEKVEVNSLVFLLNMMEHVGDKGCLVTRCNRGLIVEDIDGGRRMIELKRDEHDDDLKAKNSNLVEFIEGVMEGATPHITSKMQTDVEQLLKENRA